MTGKDQDSAQGEQSIANSTGQPFTLTQMRVERLGINDGMPYAKADLTAFCRVGLSYAISFYQFDYQSVVSTQVLAASAQQETGVVPTTPIPVAKIVMDEDGFRRLFAEVNRIAAATGITASPEGYMTNEPPHQ